MTKLTSGNTRGKYRSRKERLNQIIGVLQNADEPMTIYAIARAGNMSARYVHTLMIELRQQGRVDAWQEPYRSNVDRWLFKVAQ